MCIYNNFGRTVGGDLSVLYFMINIYCFWSANILPPLVSSWRVVTDIFCSCIVTNCIGSQKTRDEKIIMRASRPRLLSLNILYRKLTNPPKRIICLDGPFRTQTRCFCRSRIPFSKNSTLVLRTKECSIINFW